MSKPRIVILGAGAVGGYFGGRLIEHDAAEVKFLVSEKRKAYLDRHGISLTSPHGNLEPTHVDALTVAQLDGANPDYLLVACKAYDLEQAMQSIAPVAGPNTAIVPLLNGLVHLDYLKQRFPPQSILGGTVSLQVRLSADGVVEHLNDWQFITIGELEGGISDRVTSLVAALEKAKVTAAASTNIQQTMWEKIVMLATLAAMTTLMRAPVGVIARTPGGADLTLRMLELNASAAAHAGHAVPADQLAHWRSMFADPTSTLTASMLADMQRSAPVEADHIVGDMLRRVAAAGLDTTLHAMAYSNLKAYELQREGT